MGRRDRPCRQLQSWSFLRLYPHGLAIASAGAWAVAGELFSAPSSRLAWGVGEKFEKEFDKGGFG